MQQLERHTRKTVSLSDEMWQAIDDYRHRMKLATEVEAVRRLLAQALAQSRGGRKKNPA